MKKALSRVLITLFLCCSFAYAVEAGVQSSVTAGGVQFQLPDGTSGALLRIAGEDGRIFEQRYEDGRILSLSARLEDGTELPDGVYQWEIIASPVRSDRGRRSADRSSGDKAERVAIPGAAQRVSSGTFRIEGGMFVTGGTEITPTKQTSPDAGGPTPNDQVIPDDLIVQQSLCVGFDCVNNESFGFDTIRLKENNTRIKFEDTSTGTYPSNDWQLTANDSASGGANKFSIEDITGAKVPLTITAGAPTNSFFMNSLGKVGFRTSTPGLDLHMATTDTPAVRFEQTNAGGFTAQTWDIGANEANFFVRDLTGGSRLSFRIRPGAPTSSIDISASGDVGIGTASPSEKLHVRADEDANTFLLIENNGTGTSSAAIVRSKSNSAAVNFQAHATERTISRFGQTLGGWNEMLAVSGNGLAVGTFASTPLILGTNSVNRVHITAAGNVGIGTASPTNPLQMASGAHVTAGGVWTNASSRALKDDIHPLSADEAIRTVNALQPVTFRYKSETDEEYVGFVAEDVPSLVATNDRASLSSMDVVAVLTKVVQEQNRTIEEQRQMLEALAAKVEKLESDQR